MFWRTDGQWSAPVIVMVACGAYRPGLGPYHAQTFESILAHTPGIDVVMPSTAGDAAGIAERRVLVRTTDTVPLPQGVPERSGTTRRPRTWIVNSRRLAGRARCVPDAI